jgi:hypothetical protein
MMFGGNESHDNVPHGLGVVSDIHIFLCIWSGDMGPNVPHTNNL